MNYLREREKEIRNAQRVYLVATNDEYYEELETTGRLYIDAENRHFVFVAEDKPLILNTEYELYELVTEDEVTKINLDTREHFYSFIDKEEMDKATAELLMAGKGETETHLNLLKQLKDDKVHYEEELESTKNVSYDNFNLEDYEEAEELPF